MFDMLQAISKIETTATGKLILCFLATSTDPEGKVVISQSVFADACGVSVRSVNAYVARFKKAGVLAVAGRRPGHRSLIYKVNLGTTKEAVCGKS